MERRTLAVLPRLGGLWLHRVEGLPEPLVEIPTSGPAITRLDATERRLVVLDQSGKRTHTYRIEGDGLERELAPTHLPNGRTGLCVELVGDTLFVGGHSHDGEAAWSRSPRQPGYEALPVPPNTFSPGKGVDALFARDGRLIGIDDLVIPKWGVTWDVTDPAVPTLFERVQIPAHTSHERVRHAALGDRFVAVLSRGVNHGRVSVHLSILDADSLLEVFSYGWWDSTPGTWRVPEPPLHLRPLASCAGLAFAAEVLFLACADGLLAIDFSVTRGTPHEVDRWGFSSGAPEGPRPVRIDLDLESLAGVLAVAPGEAIAWGTEGGEPAALRRITLDS